MDSTDGLGGIGKHVRELIRADQKQTAKTVLEAEVLRGLNSGPSARMTREDWESIRVEVRQRGQKRKRS